MNTHNAYKIFFGLLAFELFLTALNLPTIPGVIWLTDSVSSLVPAVKNFKLTPAAAQNVAPFIALTCMLIPAKVFGAYLMILRLSPMDKELVVCFPSSDATITRRVISSALLFLLSVAAGWYLFTFGDAYFSSPEVLRSAGAKYRLVSGGGVGMWLGWSVMHLALICLLWGLLLAFVTEWFRLLFNLKGNGE